ncbi:alpha/beta hydrolase [Mucilaginibacter sp. PAMB04274]|uniref:alpha/beta hydrolase n=1 Tax=Mucilaginibacter sp. PAMB04274 TaxID=3138568 RepID=UPI0031F6D33B
MRKVFLISGLGADHRLFDKLELPGFDLVHVNWIEPEAKDTLSSYAQKLVETYGITPQSTVIGVSMGGMITVEISSLMPLRTAVIISSIKSVNEFPPYFKFFRRVPIYKIIPHGFYTSMGLLIKPLFGELRGKSGFLFVDMIKNTSPVFMRWAMHAIVNWQPKPLRNKIYHIIGNKDLIFSHTRIKDATYIIERGSHDMVYTRGKEISKIIEGILTDETT